MLMPHVSFNITKSVSWGNMCKIGEFSFSPLINKKYQGGLCEIAAQCKLMLLAVLLVRRAFSYPRLYNGMGFCRGASFALE